MADRPSRDRPKVLDEIGKLCQAGKDVATYLHQQPADEAQRVRMREILDGIIEEAPTTQHRELKRIAEELKQQALEGPPSIAQAELLQDGFDRMVKLWQAARSGLF